MSTCSTSVCATVQCMPSDKHSATELSPETQEVLRRRELLSPDQLAEYLGVPIATVYRWRARRTGPCGLRVGRHVRYRWADVESWLEAQADKARSA